MTVRAFTHMFAHRLQIACLEPPYKDFEKQQKSVLMALNAALKAHNPLKKDDILALQADFFGRLQSLVKNFENWQTGNFKKKQTPYFVQSLLATKSKELFNELIFSALDLPVSHDHETWLNNYSKSKNKLYRKGERAFIYQQTRYAMNHGFMVDGKTCFLSQEQTLHSQQETRLYHRLPAIQSKNQIQDHEISVWNQDTFEAALLLQNDGLNPVVLNMANATHPGGGVLQGASAQEESLFRRSNYASSLMPHLNTHLNQQLPTIKGKKHYLIPEFGAIYTPNVQVFRGPEKEGCKFTKPKSVHIIASAAYDLNKHLPYKADLYQANMKEKIRAVLRVAHLHNHDSLILGAWGAGAFKNDPNLIAQLFNDVLQEKEFSDCFKKIVFAVIDDNKSLNHQIFKKHFSNENLSQIKLRSRL